jgi:formylglycine-generating enzyme required for sulfatase activity
VNWNDAQSYVSWLSQKTGKRYRLLSEAEWEYAARAGTTTAFYWGNTADPAFVYINPHDGTVDTRGPVEVGSYPPNAFGLYDMLGNVWEWTEDCWNKSYIGAPSDGSAWILPASNAAPKIYGNGNCDWRVMRGGGWSESKPIYLRSALRAGTYIGNRYIHGFRVARRL